METSFTPIYSTFGGVLIGTAAVVLMAFSGRIAGATGILSGALFSRDRTWRLAFLVGMMAAPIALGALGHSFAIDVANSKTSLVVGGVLVGVGVTVGSGCTSGHGVCGLARFSKRSLVATVTFMIMAAFTVYVLRHIVEFS